ncbi:MAG: NfeD family protein [Verrucomicrobiota bacterium]
MMIRLLAVCLGFVWGLGSLGFADVEEVSDAASESAEESIEAIDPNAVKFYVIDVKDAIGKPVLFAIRNGVKEAIRNESDVVVLDMDTPGGRLDVTLEIMEILDKFPGKTITYVNGDATSAGAIIASVTNEIYMGSRATIGSAEVVTGQGEDVQDSMKRKINSYLNAKLEAYTDQYPYRAEVIRAMMDPAFEFKIGDDVISAKDELLNLNAKRAHQEYGDPPMPLLGSGIVDDLDDLMDSLALGNPAVVERFDSTWSLELASLLVSVAPFLITIGMIGVYIEFQTPGFGIPGIVGVSAFVIAIFGHSVAGLAGSEALLFLVLGIILLAVEIFVFPGSLIFAMSGIALMLGSLIWSMTDIWPEGTPGFEWNFGMFVDPIINLMIGMIFGVVGIAVLVRFLPKTAGRNPMVLGASIGGTSKGSADTFSEETEDSLIGKIGVAMSDLYPSGQVEVEGQYYEVRLDSGSLERGERVKVVSKETFGYVVEGLEE